MTLPVVEIFGPTLQGEGPAAGRNAAFLRLGGCNLSCSWCDTPESWDGQRFDLRRTMTPMSVAAILDALPDTWNVVVTGGEPLLYQRSSAWPRLLAELRRRYLTCHLETNGTLEPTDDTLATFGLIAVSPKLPHAGGHRGRQNPAPWAGWSAVDNAYLKVVVQSAADVDRALETARAGQWPLTRVWVMPEGRSAAEINDRWPAVAAAAAGHGINATHRLHILTKGAIS